MKMYLKRTGFTLVEVLVASTIGAFIALVSIGALRAVTASTEIIEKNINTAAELSFASKMLKRDLVNIYRDKDRKNMRLIGMADESNNGYLVFYTIGRAKARAAEPEGDMYEVEYYLLADEDKSVLMRRLWPNPNEEFEPGGILTAIAENIEVFEVRYFDGEEWGYEWPEEMEILPLLVEINIVAKQTEPGQLTTNSIIVNLTRSVGSMLEEEQSDEESGD